jgi:hypothetical protein
MLTICAFVSRSSSFSNRSARFRMSALVPWIGVFLPLRLRHRDLLPIVLVVTETHQTSRSGSRLTLAHRAVRRFAQVSIELSIRPKYRAKHSPLPTRSTGHQRKALRADAVNHAEVQTLRKIALLFRDLIQRALKTCAAVTRCRSAPELNASMKPRSPENSARMRNSICE